MPKGKNKRKQRDNSHREEGEMATVPATLDDSDSVCDSISDSIISDEELCEEGPVDDESELVFQLSEHIDQLTDKSSRVRLNSLSYINHTMKHRIIVSHLMGRIETVTDIIVRGLKKVTGTERQELLQMASLLSLQFGDEYSDMFIAYLQPVLTLLVQDSSISSVERSTALSTLSFCTFLLCQDFKQVEIVMHECERVYCSKVDTVMIIAAIKGWTLLLSILPNHMIPAVLLSQLPQLSHLLQVSADLSLRICIGHGLALLIELARETDEELLECEGFDAVKTVVASIASESNRYTAKKDRSQQRASFKDISHSLETGYVPERNIKFGMESLCLDTWSRIVQYTAITELLATGCRTHLLNNETVREIFQLGSPLIVQQETKADKIERKLYNAASAKWRTQSRGKLRDKRSVV